MTEQCPPVCDGVLGFLPQKTASYLTSLIIVLTLALDCGSVGTKASISIVWPWTVFLTGAVDLVLYVPNHSAGTRCSAWHQFFTLLTYFPCLVYYLVAVCCFHWGPKVLPHKWFKSGGGILNHLDIFRLMLFLIHCSWSSPSSWQFLADYMLQRCVTAPHRSKMKMTDRQLFT